MLEINSLQEFSDKDSLLQSIAKWSDVEIDQLKEYIMHSWPRHIPNRMLPYSKSPHEHTIQAEIMYRSFCIIPPRHLWPHILHTLHRDHPGIVHMIRLARQYFWWPGIDAPSTRLFRDVIRVKSMLANGRVNISDHGRMPKGS